jgi:hypothetical protein
VGLLRLSTTPAEHDYVAVYTQNTDASRVDYSQTRSIKQQVLVLTDGSALVTRSTRITNPTPPRRERSAARAGSLSLYSMPTVATYLPPAATLCRYTSTGGSPEVSSQRKPVGASCASMLSSARGDRSRWTSCTRFAMALS